jgi:hypothetical protein
VYNILLRDTKSGDTASMNLGCPDYIPAMIDYSEMFPDLGIEIVGYREISFEEAKTVQKYRDSWQQAIVDRFGEAFFAWYNGNGHVTSH